jgi:hypothetical protein
MIHIGDQLSKVKRHVSATHEHLRHFTADSRRAVPTKEIGNSLEDGTHWGTTSNTSGELCKGFTEMRHGFPPMHASERTVTVHQGTPGLVKAIPASREVNEAKCEERHHVFDNETCLTLAVAGPER